MFKPAKILSLLARIGALLLSGCAGQMAGETCLDLAERGAATDSIRAAGAPQAKGGKALCDGLAYLHERKLGAARDKLSAAVAKARPEERWPIQGALAKVQAMDQLGEAALHNWSDAIAGAAAAKDERREAMYRADRGIYWAQKSRFGEALVDLGRAHELAEDPRAKAELAYAAFKVTASMERLDLMERWYPLAMAATEAVGAADKMAYATEFYGQVLDKRGDFAASDAIYRQGIEAVRRTGDKAALADVMEFHGQSRFAAGDREAGRESYGRSAELYGATGHRDYQDFMGRNGRAMDAHAADRAQDGQP